LSNEQQLRFLKLWEPSLWLADAKLPMLWINGTNDPHFPMDSWQKSIRSAKGSCMQRAEINMPHGSKWAFMNKEAVAFANSILNNDDPLPNFGEVKRTSLIMEAQVTSAIPITKVELFYTLDTCNRTIRQWEKIPASIQGTAVTAILPPNTVAYFINVTDRRGLMVSSEYIEIDLDNYPNTAFIQQFTREVWEPQPDNPAALSQLYGIFTVYD
jgi:PhoPQ-activated pathogenicity-related protein